MDEKIQIQLRNISKQYRLYKTNTGRIFDLVAPFIKKKYQAFTALDNINLVVNSGEIVGIIGRNGSGKSTLLRIIAGITSPTSGSVNVYGKIVPLFELGAGFHADLTGWENLNYFAIMQNFDKSKASKIIEQAIEFAEIGPFIDQPLRTYSRGMRARLAFSISIFINADILAIDEALAVGDTFFKEKSQQKMHDMLLSGKTILLVTHSEQEIKKVCTRAILLQNGKLIMDGSPEEVLKKYKAINPKVIRGNKKQAKE